MRPTAFLALLLSLAFVLSQFPLVPAPQAHAADQSPVAVTVSYQADQTGFVLAPQTVALGGSPTLRDVLVVAHERLYGVENVSDKLTFDSNDWGEFVSVAFGEPSGNFLYYLNHQTPADLLDTTLQNGDVVQFYVPQDTIGWSDFCAWFDSSATLRGETWDASQSFPVANANIVPLIPNGLGATFGDPIAVTDADGAFPSITAPFDVAAVPQAGGTPFVAPVLPARWNVKSALTAALDWLEANDSGDWSLFVRARAGRKNAPLPTTVNPTKSTDYARLVLTLTANCVDPRSFQGIDLVTPLSDLETAKKQGVAALAYTLIALDCHTYPADRDAFCAALLACELPGGGFGFGASADPDVTAMVVQALAPYREIAESAIAAAIDRALPHLADETAVFSESLSQAILARAALGESPSPALLARFFDFCTDFGWAHEAYHPSDAAAWAHGANAIATEQAAMALWALDNLPRGRKLFDMNDFILETVSPSVVPSASATSSASPSAQPSPTATSTPKPSPSAIPKTIPVTLNANGGKLGKSKTKSLLVSFAQKLKLTQKPTRKGYKFKGWYDKKKGGKRIKSLKITKSLKLYAHWKKK